MTVGSRYVAPPSSTSRGPRRYPRGDVIGAGFVQAGIDLIRIRARDVAGSTNGAIAA